MPNRPQVISTPHRIKKLSQKEYDRRRPSSHKRGYNRSHYRLRKMIFAEQPICIVDGCNKQSQELDHINGNPFDRRRENLQGMCKSHHSEKTMREIIGRKT